MKLTSQSTIAQHAVPPAPRGGAEIQDGRYLVKVAESHSEIETALRLRYEVFNLELGGGTAFHEERQIEFDEFDLSCKHLLVVDRKTSKTVGTYRLNSVETARGIQGFYSHREFSIEDLPSPVWQDGVEIGRACIAREHRNTKVLFLLWKGLARYLQTEGKRFFFGCCSIFTRDESVGARAFRQLVDGGHRHDNFRVVPRQNELKDYDAPDAPVELPSLFNMYLRMGAKVCGPAMIDRNFGTIDFFVVCDTEKINEKYRRMFFA